MANMHKHPAAQPNMPAVARILAHYDRESLEAFLSVALDLLDTMDGDPEAENGNDLEDDFALSENAIAYGSGGAGCAISDQDAGAYVEWHTMHGSQKGGANILAGQEDDENDDPAEEDDEPGQCDEDELNTGFDRVRYTPGASGPGCAISDAGGGNVEDEAQLDDVRPYTGPL